MIKKKGDKRQWRGRESKARRRPSKMRMFREESAACGAVGRKQCGPAAAALSYACMFRMI